MAPLLSLHRPSWHRDRAGPIGPGRARPRPSQEPASGLHHSSGQWPARYSIGQWPAHLRQAAQAPDPFQVAIIPGSREPGAAQPGTRAASPEVITVGVHPGRDSPLFARKVPVRRQPNSGPSPPFPLTPATGVNRRIKPGPILYSDQFGLQSSRSAPLPRPCTKLDHLPHRFQLWIPIFSCGFPNFLVFIRPRAA